MAFFSIAALRAVLTTETDADSPGSEELLGQMRENWEALLMILLDTDEGGTVTTIAETVLTDSGQSWNTDEHIGRTLLITSGTAIGNTYTIDDNDGTTLTLTGDTLVSDGVIITDTFLIFFDLTNAGGHDHDGVNSKYIDSERWIGTLFTSDSGQGTTAADEIQIGWYWYKPSDADTLYAKCDLKVQSGSETTTLTIAVGAAEVEITQGPDDANWHNGKTGSLDISGVATGWNLVTISLGCTGGDIGTVRYLGMYVI